MSKLILESVFTIFTALYNKETGIVLFAGQEYTYDDFDDKYLISHIYTIDEYNFEKELLDQLYHNHLYEESLIEYYNPSAQCYF